jgi:hypothetical protein
MLPNGLANYAVPNSTLSKTDVRHGAFLSAVI